MTSESTHDRAFCQGMLDDVQARLNAAHKDLAQRHALAQALMDEAEGVDYGGVPSVRESGERFEETCRPLGIGHLGSWAQSYREAWSKILQHQAACVALSMTQERVRHLQEKIAALTDALTTAQEAEKEAYDAYLDTMEPLAFDQFVPQEPALPARPDPDSDYDLPF